MSLSTRPAPEMSPSREKSLASTPTTLEMVSNLSQNSLSLLRSSLTVRLLLMPLTLLLPLPPLLVDPVVLSSSTVDSVLDSVLVLDSVMAFYSMEEALADLVQEDLDSMDLLAATDGPRLVTTPSTPLPSHLMTDTSTP